MAKKEAWQNFLAQRKLTRSFNEYRKLPRDRTVTEINFKDYSSGGLRGKRIIIAKQNKVYVIRDFFTLKKIGSSKKPLPQLMKDIHTSKKIGGVPSVITKKGAWNIISERKERVVKLRNEQSYTTVNHLLGRTTTVTMYDEPPKSRIIRGHKVPVEGFAVVDATYVGVDATVRLQTRSGSFMIGTRSGKDNAVEEALRNGSFRAGFSPIDVIINDVWFEVWRRDYVKKRQL